jgi:hypothetical protein
VPFFSAAERRCKSQTKQKDDKLQVVNTHDAELISQMLGVCLCHDLSVTVDDETLRRNWLVLLLKLLHSVSVANRLVLLEI